MSKSNKLVAMLLGTILLAMVASLGSVTLASGSKPTDAPAMLTDAPATAAPIVLTQAPATAAPIVLTQSPGSIAPIVLTQAPTTVESPQY